MAAGYHTESRRAAWAGRAASADVPGIRSMLSSVTKLRTYWTFGSVQNVDEIEGTTCRDAERSRWPVRAGGRSRLHFPFVRVPNVVLSGALGRVRWNES